MTAVGATNRTRWGYAASKMIDEVLGLAYWRQHGLEVVPFRLFNTVGPRQTGEYGMVVSRFVAQALKQEITIQGPAEKVKELTGSASPIVKVPYAEAYAPGFEDIQRRVPSIERIQTTIGWQPTRSLEQIFSKTS